MKELEELAEEALHIRDQLNPRNTDQAFINYCCDVKPVQYGHFAEVIGGICQQGWANQPGTVYEQDGAYYLWNYEGLDHKKQTVLLHWAGISRGPMMPERKWLLRFRYDRASPLRWAAEKGRNLAQYPFLKTWRSFRSQRHLNELYHATFG